MVERPNSEEQFDYLFNGVEKMIEGLEQTLERYKPSFNSEIFYTDKELSEKLRVSRRTLQSWRDDGLIDYIQLSGKILYSESAVQTLLNKYHREAWE
ncbi:MAG: helix-turn-helix domain-containing protein [Rikenellaceae bacterium]